MAAAGPPPRGPAPRERREGARGAPDCRAHVRGRPFSRTPRPGPPGLGGRSPPARRGTPGGTPQIHTQTHPGLCPPPPHHRHGQTLPAKQQAPTDLLTLASADQTNWSLIAVGHGYGLLEHALSSSSDSSDKVRPPLKRGLQLLRNPVLNAACPQSHRLTTPRESSSQAGWKKAAV